MKRPFFLLALFLVILILAFRFFVREDIFFPGHISHFASEKPRHLSIKGTVVSDPFYRYLYFRKAEAFIVDPALVRASKRWFPAYGNIRVTSYSEMGVEYGDEILFEAAVKIPLARGDSSFDYRRYLERFGIYALATISDKAPVIITGEAKGSSLKRFAYNVKGLLRRNIKSLFRPPERYFLTAVLLGDRQDIPKKWRDIFSKTQTMHLLAISGLHVGIIAFIMLFLVGILGIRRNLRCAITILILVLYAIMVGGRPSVVRATVMGTVLLASYILKRDVDIYNSLGLAAAVILIYNPDQLFDYGFILSFTSVFFIVYITPYLNRIFGVDEINRKTHLGAVSYYFSTLSCASFAVWMGLFPLTASIFNIISPISVVVNILAIPALFVIIALSALSLILHPIFAFLGIVFAEAAKFFIDILILFLEASSKLPFAYFEAESLNIHIIILYYIALIGLIEYGKKHANMRKSGLREFL